MLEIDKIFFCRSFDFSKLAALGFEKSDVGYRCRCPLASGGFSADIRVSSDGRVEADVIDTETGDIYALVKSPSATGAFVGRIRAELTEILQKIADECTFAEIFQTPFAKDIIRYAKEKYQDDFEFLWPKFPKNAVVRRQDNQKWYAAILTAAADKIGREGKEILEIIDLRCPPPELEKLVDGKRYFPGYHMNKKHWLTICLDGSVPLAEILERLDVSYALAKK